MLARRFGGTIALVSPRTASDYFMAALPVEELAWEGHGGWRVVRVSQEMAGRPVSDVDFSAVDIPVLLDNLAADPGTALIVAGRSSNGSPDGCPPASRVASRCWDAMMDAGGRPSGEGANMSRLQLVAVLATVTALGRCRPRRRGP